MPSFDELLILDDNGWRMHLHPDQHYLGRAYLWLKRPGDMQRLSHLRSDEVFHLHWLTCEYEQAVDALWAPNHMNYAWLGNDFGAHSGHGHLHLIPRYARPLTFAGSTFTDDRWGKNYAPYESRAYPNDILFMIRDAISTKISERRYQVFESIRRPYPLRD